MDSRMLNVFHEDPFEGNFVKYDPDSNFWSTTDDDLQLTDTLIAPTDDTLLSQKEAEEQLQNSKNLLIYSDFVDQHLSDDAQVLNGQIYRAITDSEVEVCEQQLQLSGLIDSYNDEEDSVERLEDDDDRQSQCSNSTFRTRTDSSSIGDYESHSSDYDDDVDNDTTTNRGEAVDNECLLTADTLTLLDDRKIRTLSTNTVGSDADAFGLNIDVNNFDLADFITKDDFADNLTTVNVKEPLPEQVMKQPIYPMSKPKKIMPNSKGDGVAPLHKPVVISSKSRDSDYDSDSIIDVETVDVIDVDETLYTAGLIDETVATEDLCYVDNVKADPSWCPKQTKRIVAAEKKTTTGGNPIATKATASASQAVTKPAESSTPPTAVSTVKQKATNNICLVPNKKQCDFLKRKVGNKAASSVTTNKSKVSAKKMQEANKSTAGKQLTVAKVAEPQPITGLGLGGKNLALLKHERDAAAATPITAATSPAPKRKLNLEEYKQRRCGAVINSKSQANGISTASSGPTPVKQVKLEVNKSVPPTPIPKAQPSPNKAAISNIVNSLKCPAKSPAETIIDPITAAKNKVLRMLEMKRAQQLKIIDSRVTAKVPRVTKLPPLKDIVKDTYCMETEPETELANPQVNTKTEAKRKLQADYEEIIIVSTSCNTDITIPPYQASIALRDNKTTPSSRSLLKSSVLLYNISNGSEAGKDMTNSLIASIQSEVVRQTNCVALGTSTATGTTTTAGDKNLPHGEDMVIMHLAKNRIRKRMVSMGTQTDLQPEFPLLTLPTTRQSRERTRRSYRKRRIDGSVSNGSSCSSSSSSSNCSSIASYRSRSNSNSTERLRHSDATAAGSSSIGCGGYSSRSTRRHRSSVSSSSFSESGKYEQRQRQRRTSYNKRRSKNANRENRSTSRSDYSDRERSRSPLRRSRSRSPSDARYGNNKSSNNRRAFVDRNVSQPAVEERRIVYVGRIEQETTKEMLRRKFLRYGSIKNITIHYKENGMKYGFVTFECAQDAFTAIDSSPRDEQINMYDISFGGRRAFCRASYADLDNAGINNLESYVYPKAALAAPPQEDSFEAMLLNLKAKLNAGKPATAQPTPASAKPEATTASPVDVATVDSSTKNNSQI